MINLIQSVSTDTFLKAGLIKLDRLIQVAALNRPRILSPSTLSHVETSLEKFAEFVKQMGWVKSN